MARTRLVWKWEEGYEKGETPVGPAWIDTLDEGKRTSTERLRVVNGSPARKPSASRVRTTTTCCSTSSAQG